MFNVKRTGTGARHLAGPGRFIAHYARLHAIGFALLGSAVVLASAAAVTAQYQMKVVVDAMTSINGSVWMAFAVFLAASLAESGLLRLCAVMTCRLTIRIGVTMRLDLFDYLTGQSMRYFADNLAGSLGQRITGTAGHFGALVNTAVWRLGPPLVDFAGALAIFASINWHLAAVMGTYVVAATTALILIGNRGRGTHIAYFRNASGIAGDLIDVISNIWAVKAFSAHRVEFERLRRGFEQEADKQGRSWMYTEKTRIGYDFMLWLMSGSMSCWALLAWQRHAMTPGDVVIISALTFRVLHGAREFSLALVDAAQQVGYIEDTLQAVGKVHSIADARDAWLLVPAGGTVEFRNVSFGYEHHHPTLPSVNFRIERGEKVGIVGASGAGKSTIIQLIQRLHDVQTGEILIDGQPIVSLSQAALRGALSVVPQDVSLFHRSVMENIRFGRPGATDEEVMAAARAACCEGFVNLLPQGLDTQVGERGVKLSGGQRQRVGIARALLKAAPILLLDEATSALDTRLELQIQESIRRVLHDRTVIAVAHRLSTLASFDRVFVMDHGCIVEEGSPAELRRRGSLFNQLWRLQAHGMTTPSVVDWRNR